MSIRTVAIGTGIVGTTVSYDQPDNYNLTLTHQTMGYVEVNINGGVLGKPDLTNTNYYILKITPLNGINILGVKYYQNGVDKSTVLTELVKNDGIWTGKLTGGNIPATGVNAFIIDIENSGSNPNPNPTPELKNFLIYNGTSFAGASVWTGDITCDAKVTTYSKYDSTNNVETILKLGVNTKVDLASVDKATIELTAHSGFIFNYFKKNSYNDFQLNSHSKTITFDLSETELINNYSTMREYQVGLIADSNIEPEPEPEPVVTYENREFFIYNKTGKLDFATQQYELLWDGEVNIFANIIIKRPFDESINDYVYENTSLLIGVSQVVSIPSDYINISVEIKPFNGFNISDFQNNYNSIENITFPNKRVLYSLTEYDLKQVNGYSHRSFRVYTSEETETPLPVNPNLSNHYYLDEVQFNSFRNEITGIVAVEKANESKILTSQFISSIKVYPFNIPENILLGNNKIQIREYTLNSEGNMVSGEYITMTYGTIQVDQEYNNSLDFINVDVNLYIPFMSGSISIDPTYIIGRKVEILVNVVIGTGVATLNLKDVESGNIYNISTHSVGSDYPIMGMDTNNIKFEPNQVINNIRQAYVIIKKPNYTGVDVLATRKGVLTDVKGYVKVNNVSINNVSTHNEKENLIYILKQGVFIK